MAVSNIVNNNHSSNLSKNTNTINPFIEVAIFTAGTQTSEQAKFRTRIVYGNGFNPVFDSQFRITFSVPPDMLDLAFLRLKVIVKYGGEEISLGKYTVSLPVLMPGKRVLLRSIFFSRLIAYFMHFVGYRHVPLYDHLGQQYLFSSLFICTQLHKQAPDFP